MTVGLAALMIGCGDGDGETTTTQEWVTAADAICAEMNTQLEPISEPQTIEEFADASAQVNEIWRNGLDELQELDLPDGNEAAATEVLDAFDQLVDVSLQWSDAVIAAGSMEVEDMTPELETLFVELDASSAKARQLAEIVGLQQCFTNQES
jgi:hypothetical protein